jgi:dihydropteroate synthase
MRRGTVALDRPVIVGIVNVTPDSFSDGGRYLDPEAAVAHAVRLVEEGADVLDIGAESTRPGRPEPVSAEEEWRRLVPVLDGIARRLPAFPVTVDTVKSETARRALDAGAWAVNDVAGLRLDLRIADACAAHGAGLVLMHSRGTVTDMATYDHAVYASVGEEVVAELARAAEAAAARGVDRAAVVLDPGLGFSKTPDQSFAAVAALPGLARLGYPIMIGPSRKRMLGAVTGREVHDRDVATAVACAVGYVLGARLFRVHAPAVVREALAVAHAVRSG